MPYGGRFDNRYARRSRIPPAPTEDLRRFPSRHPSKSAANGSFELRMYAGDRTTAIESHIVTMNTGTSIGAVQIGAITAAPAGLGMTVGLDSLAYGTSNWFGPASS